MFNLLIKIFFLIFCFTSFSQNVFSQENENGYNYAQIFCLIVQNNLDEAKNLNNTILYQNPKSVIAGDFKNFLNGKYGEDILKLDRKNPEWKEIILDFLKKDIPEKISSAVLKKLKFNLETIRQNDLEITRKNSIENSLLKKLDHYEKIIYRFYTYNDIKACKSVKNYFKSKKLEQKNYNKVSSSQNKNKFGFSLDNFPEKCLSEKNKVYYGTDKKYVYSASNLTICNYASNKYRSDWETENPQCEYTVEAFNRNLNCPQIYKNSGYRFFHCYGLDCNDVEQEKFMKIKLDNRKLCETATYYSNKTKKIEWNLKYARSSVDEARKKGLTCGVDGAVAEKEESVKQIIAREKERKAIEEKERKAIEEKERKLAEERARKKRIAEEKARKKKQAAEKARKKKLAEQERKRKLEQDKIVQKIRDYKRQAVNFYKDVEEFVKSGGKIDLVKLSNLFNVKPNPKKNWNSSDLKTYENLRQFMNSISEFVTYEKQMIGERLKKSFALKDQSIAQLEKNLDDLKGLMRKMFGSSDTPKITKMISDIEASLNDFNQSKANKLIVQTTNYISSKLDKPRVVETNKETKVIKKASTDQSWSDYKFKLSPRQEQFCKLTNDFYKDLTNARKSKNDIRINKVHKQRQQNLDGLIPNGKIQDWIFKVIKIQQIENGSAAVILKLQCKSFVGSGQIHTRSTWRSKSNKEWRATIPYDDRRFRELEKLSAGEFVLGSGTLLEVNAFKPGQIETFYASQQIGEHPLTKDLNLEGELFLADLSYIAALN